MQHVSTSFFSATGLSGLMLTLLFVCASPAALSQVAVEVATDDVSAISQLARNGKVQQALDKLEQSLSVRPRDPRLRFLKGVLLTEIGQAAQAMAIYISLTQDYPELPEPYNNLAALYADQNQFEKAHEALATAVRIKPDYDVALDNLGDVYAQLARQSYARALQIKPANATIAQKLKIMRELIQTRP